MPAGKDAKNWFGCEQELCQVGYVSCLLYDFYKLWLKALWESIVRGESSSQIEKISSNIEHFRKLRWRELAMDCSAIRGGHKQRCVQETSIIATVLTLTGSVDCMYSKSITFRLAGRHLQAASRYTRGAKMCYYTCQ